MTRQPCPDCGEKVAIMEQMLNSERTKRETVEALLLRREQAAWRKLKANLEKLKDDEIPRYLAKFWKRAYQTGYEAARRESAKETA